jgi:hypothetical protein
MEHIMKMILHKESKLKDRTNGGISNETMDPKHGKGMRGIC